jgi:hypothetical protein
MMTDEREHTDDEARKNRELIRKWYADAKRMGISDEDFYREMGTIRSQEELEEALDGFPQEDADNPSPRG